MFIRTQYLRAGNYLRRHGLKSSAKRVFLEIKNRIFRNRLVLYARDLHGGEFEGHALPEDCRIERFYKRSEMPDRLYKRITEHSSEELLQKYIQKRFENGACLWCLRDDTEDIGYTWTLTNRAMKAFCLPPMGQDVYLMDTFVFPPHRGRGMSSILRNYVLKHYKSEGFCRAYSEAWEWNASIMKAMAKNGFVRVGMVRKRFRRGKGRWTFLY